MDLIPELTPHLRRLRLSGVLETLEARHKQAVMEQLGHLEFLSMLVMDEVERRNMKQLAGRLKRAGFSSEMTLEGFDFSFNPGINRRQVMDLSTGRFIERRENVFLIGPSGVGKTHLACALAHSACRRGFEVQFHRTSQLLGHLNQGRADGTWNARLSHLLKPDLLILDDWGLKKFGVPAADDLYELINERYEKGSLIVTSNRALDEWPELWGDALVASAAMDRMVHHAHVITITGKSYRARNVASSGDLKREVEKV
jgi:DNA replication protein DnaC